MSASAVPSTPASTFRVAAGETALDALRVAGVELTGPHGAVVVRDSDGELRDLAWAPTDDAEVEAVTAESPDGLAVLRHSAAHAMAQAVQELFPGTLLGIGPPIEDGFYYDFLPERPFTPDDLTAIEKKMGEIIKSGQRFARRPIDDDAARAELLDERFKLELIGLKTSGSDAGAEPEPVSAEESVEVGAGGLTMYDNLDAKTGELVWTDLCRGPHLPTTRRIPAVKLMRSAAAYWRGSEKNEQLQRIYGTAWATRDDLKAYLARLEEAAKRDHRKLGAELDLFSFPDEIGSGLPVFHPKGGVIKREMEDYVRRRHIEEGFEYVGTPHISKEGLFYTSGHLPYYAEGMFPALDVDGSPYRLKAMNCPMHNLIYRSRGRSYRDLPLRLFEFGHVYRHEKSGVVHGLTRVRGFAQDDSHSYVTPEQAPGEIAHLLDFCLGLFRDFGLDDFYLELSTRDDSHPDKFIGSHEEWAVATEVLRDVAVNSGLELVPDPGGAAYYGPKISVQARDAIGRTWQMSTIQYDFNQPRGFELEYQAADGTRQRPVMIHSAKFGSIERFIGVLTEHYAGAFPVWLSPVQVTCIPVADDYVDYLYQVADVLRRRGIRVEVDSSDDRMQKKIRSAQKSKVPFMLIAGAADVEAGAVSFRYRDGSQRNGIPIDQATDEIVDAIARRVNMSPSAEMYV
ncbi:MAG: threonine--tRNA ligase [Jatrophihabitans sp.]